MVCAFLINSVSFLQGASLSTSSVILYELQGNSSDHNQDLSIFKDFHITEEEGSWIGIMEKQTRDSSCIPVISGCVGAWLLGVNRAIAKNVLYSGFFVFWLFFELFTSALSIVN